MSKLLITVFIAAIAVINEVNCHGMMSNPPGRSSVWRTYSGYAANYNDNANYCGGLWVAISLILKYFI